VLTISAEVKGGLATLVSRVSAGGATQTVARLPNLQVRSFELLDRRWAVLSGSAQDKVVVYVVDVETGLVIDSLRGQFSAAAVLSVPPLVPEPIKAALQVGS
jgi:hypothetical protein